MRLGGFGRFHYVTSCNTLENLSKMTINYCYEITITRRKTSINSGEIEDSLAYECKLISFSYASSARRLLIVRSYRRQKQQKVFFNAFFMYNIVTTLIYECCLRDNRSIPFIALFSFGIVCFHAN